MEHLKASTDAASAATFDLALGSGLVVRCIASRGWERAAQGGDTEELDLDAAAAAVAQDEGDPRKAYRRRQCADD